MGTDENHCAKNGDIRVLPTDMPCYEEMLRCTCCGYCQAACPTFEILHREGVTARGRLQLLRGVAERTIPLTDAVGASLWFCPDCQLCAQHCPGGVHLEEIFSMARQALAETVAFPQSLKDLKNRIEQAHNILGDLNDKRCLWLNPEEDIFVSSDADTVYWVGCGSAFDPSLVTIPLTFGHILNALGVPFALLGGEEWCCGYPLVSAGLPADTLISHNLQALEDQGIKRLITTCSLCYHTWKTAYPSDQVEVLHAVEFLAAATRESQLTWKQNPGEPLVVTYHDPCHLGRKQGIYDAPRTVLTQIPGVEFREMNENKDAAMCCGGGANLDLLNQGLSEDIAALRLENAQKTGTSILVTACPQCQRVLTSAARKKQIALEVRDLAEFVWARMPHPEDRS